jgi:hypothetical protein
VSSCHTYERITVGRIVTVERCQYPEPVVTGQTIHAYGRTWLVDRIEPGTPARPFTRLLCLDPAAVAGGATG